VGGGGSTADTARAEEVGEGYLAHKKPTLKSMAGAIINRGVGLLEQRAVSSEASGEQERPVGEMV